MNLKHIKKIQKVLTKWNPLGDRAVQITDLNDYETEASDIVFHSNINASPIKIKDPKKRVHVIVKEILEEAFDLNLTDKECEEPAEEIFKILFKK
jgi:hypothetical protein